MTPAGGQRDNMVAWIAGRADPPDYGKLRVLRFPQDRQIFGPLQIEARIDQDATIRQQLTLLAGAANSGAQLYRGNLLVLPVGNSFLYVKPIFVQATQGKIPELQRVVLATQDRVVMAESFEKAGPALVAATTPPRDDAAPARHRARHDTRPLGCGDREGGERSLPAGAGCAAAQRLRGVRPTGQAARGRSHEAPCRHGSIICPA